MFRTILGMLLLLCSSICANDSITGKDAAYRNLCSKAAKDPYYFRNFRSMSDYAHALEITDGGAFASYISTQASKEITDKLYFFRKLDSLGNPPTAFYPRLGNFSGTTLRYIAIADEMGKLFDLPENAKIVEVGGGFGGQCYVLSHLHRWSSYYIYDLPEPNALIEKMLAALNVKNVLCMPVSAPLPEDQIDLFISNYAYSECDRETQMDYFERLIKKAKRGYILYNQISHHYSINSLSPQEFTDLLEKNGLHPQVYNERIPTYDNNLLIVWDATQ